MKNYQFSTLVKSIKTISLATSLISSFSFISSVYAQQCTNHNVNGFHISGDISCDADQSAYNNEVYTEAAISVYNGATLNITSDNVLLTKSVPAVDPQNIGVSILEAHTNAKINVLGEITIKMLSTTDINSIAIGAINSMNGSTINLYGPVTIDHIGLVTNSSSGIAAHSSGYGLNPATIIAHDLVKINTLGSVGIIAKQGSSISLKEIDVTIDNNINSNYVNLRDFGVYATNKGSNILYTSGVINSSGSALKVDDGGSITTNQKIINFIEIIDSTTIPAGIEVKKINIVNNGTQNLLAFNDPNSREITVLKNNEDFKKLEEANIEFKELPIFTESQLTTSNDKAHVLTAKGQNSLISLSGILNATTLGNEASNIYTEQGASIYVNGASDLLSKGDNATGLTATGTDSKIILNQPIILNFEGMSGTAINNSNNAVITLLGNVTSTGDTTAIKNNNAKIHFFGANNTFSGNVFNENNGVINLSNYDKETPDKDIFGKLNIIGNYTGTDSVLLIDTKLASDNVNKGDTDFITIGGSATGSTKLLVTNANGGGDRTVNGIHVIQTGSSDSDQTFYLANGAISAGAFDYLLHLKKQETTTNGTFDNWYLKSELVRPAQSNTPVYTPDVGEYLAAETMGNTLFTSRLEDREGASQYQNLGNKDTGNVWVRAYGGHNQFKSMQDQLKTKGNSFVTQIGAGLVTLGEEDQYNLGAMGGFATYDGKTRSNLTDRESKTKINGYSLGLYGTWYAHPVEKRGAYIDSWVLWNKFNNKIDTPDQNQYKYDSSGVTASIEVGGDYLLNKNGQKDWWIQPQVQLIYQGVHADNFQDAQGVDINHGKDNLQARMGVKTYLNIPTDSSKSTSYRPYVALNFIHNTNPYSVEINDIRYENEGAANLGELKLGVEGQVTKNSQVWLNASYIAGSHSNQAYQGNIGWKYNF